MEQRIDKMVQAVEDLTKGRTPNKAPEEHDAK